MGSMDERMNERTNERMYACWRGQMPVLLTFATGPLNSLRVGIQRKHRKQT